MVGSLSLILRYVCIRNLHHLLIDLYYAAKIHQLSIFCLYLAYDIGIIQSYL